MATFTNQYARDVFIIDGKRTPYLKARSEVGPFSASDLAVHAGRQLMLEQSFPIEDVDEVIVGCVGPSADEANIARIIALRLGCTKKVPAYTVQRNCASGMQALDSAAKDIAAGRCDLVIAGGTEAMSRSPLIMNHDMTNWFGRINTSRTFFSKLKTFTQFRPKMLAPVIGLLRGLRDPVVGVSMGQTAENLAAQFNISREQMDAFSVRSHQRLAEAHQKNYIPEMVPIIDAKGNVHDLDDGVRPDSSVEKLAKLKPVFDKKFGSITPGNSSQITDGSAMLLLASEDAVKRYNLPVLGRIIDCQWAALDPAIMGLGPVMAATPIMQRQNLKMKDIDFWEINEAFAAQVLACLAAWEDKDFCKEHFGLDKPVGTLDQEKLNVNGGAVALGHPVGASGARIVLHLLKVLEREKAKVGMAAICIGGGQGGAMLVEAL